MTLLGEITFYAAFKLSRLASRLVCLLQSVLQTLKDGPFDAKQPARVGLTYVYTMQVACSW